MFEHAALPMVVLDLDGRILDWNPAAERTLGYARDEAIGRSALLVRRPEDARRLELLLRRTAGDRRVADFDTWVSCSDGREIPAAMSFSYLADGDGVVTAVGVILRDRRRQKAMETRLAENAKMVALGRLAGGLSHHINNILAAVSARVELALQTGDANAARQALRLTAESVDRLSNLTRNLLLFGSFEHRRRTTCRADDVARRTLERLSQELADSGATIDARVADAPAVALDAADLQQVIQNLVLNAAEALDGPGRVSVALSTERGQAVLRVEDAGRGIPREHLEHVLEPFWTTRGSLGGGHAAGALGLGLTVARSLVAAAGGAIELDSAPGRGTVVTVRLPAAAASNGGGPAAP